MSKTIKYKEDKNFEERWKKLEQDAWIITEQYKHDLRKIISGNPDLHPGETKIEAYIRHLAVEIVDIKIHLNLIARIQKEIQLNYQQQERESV